MKHLLSLKELSGREIHDIVITGLDMKENPDKYAYYNSQKTQSFPLLMVVVIATILAKP